MTIPFTIETTYRQPIYRQRTYRAATLAEACRLAIHDQAWDGAASDVESAGETHVTGAWAGEDAACRGPAQAVPSQYRETVERRSEHFDALTDLLAEASRPMGLSEHDFRAWRPRALAAVTKAEAIRAGARATD
ncbi:hypothetical protein ACETK8_20015 (plasmid) [Brevundimonas staleyi]|uniref:Uncharacterized protein n=1 Tax=Brevundimonas staleyi TaxID=74326 RepID=A0ABW0FNF7_9CAUL